MDEYISTPIEELNHPNTMLLSANMVIEEVPMPTTTDVALWSDDLLLLLEHYYTRALGWAWIEFLYEEDGCPWETDEAEKRSDEIADVIRQSPTAFSGATDIENLIMSVLRQVEEKFFKDKDALGVKVFKGEATVAEEVHWREKMLEQEEQAEVRYKRRQSAYARVVEDRLDRVGRFERDGEGVVFHHKDRGMIPVGAWGSHGPIMNAKDAAQWRAQANAFLESDFCALLKEVFGESYATNGVLDAVSTLLNKVRNYRAGDNPFADTTSLT